MNSKEQLLREISKYTDETTIYDVIKQSDLSFLGNISKLYENNIYLKREDKHFIRSFKIRGAYQKISQLSESEKKRGIIASSAGNHAQGVAYAAKKFNIKANIVMPRSAPDIKVKAVKNLGANIILWGDYLYEANTYAEQLCKKNNYVFIHPFDDIHIIAGQGTIAKEIDNQLQKTDYIFVPVGGGGLIAGIAVYFKYKSKNKNIKIIGVESKGSPTLFEAIKQNKRVALNSVDLFADGVAVKQLGKINFAILKEFVDDVILISDDQICAAIKDIYDDIRVIPEPSGALGLSGIKEYIKKHKISNANIVGILSGANVNFDRLRYIAERAEIGENKEVLLAVAIDEKAGSYYDFLCKIKDMATITEFNYRYSYKEKGKAHIFVGITIKNGIEEKNKIIKSLKKNYEFEDLTDDELAKTHIKYMVGGRADVENERIFSFDFPETPDALYNLLQLIHNKWNISLFHYRNYGASYAKVLVGFQVQEEKISDLLNTLDTLKCNYIDQTNNKAYKYFL